MEHLNNYVKIITDLSNADIQKNWTIKYYLMADKSVNGVNGYTIDLGSYTTKSDAEIAMNKLATQTGHNKFYIVESGKWSILSNNLDGIKVNMGKLDEKGAKLFKDDYTQKCQDVEDNDKVKELIERKDEYIQHQLNLIKLAKMNKLKEKMEESLKELNKNFDVLKDKTIDYEVDYVQDKLDSICSIEEIETQTEIDLLKKLKAIN
jgi:hypothetical protein